MRPADCHPDQPHYAKGQCKKCYRSQRFGAAYQQARYGEQLRVYRANYEGTPKAVDRQQRYYRVRKAIEQVLGVPGPKLSTVFNDQRQVATLRSALKAGNPVLLDIWLELSPSQQSAIQ